MPDTYPIIPVILAGGAGTRLWPVSRKAFPKPFMTLADGETLLEKTLFRAQALASGGPILTVTNPHYAQLARRCYENAGDGRCQHYYLLEPEARNTAPAIAMAAAWAGREMGPEARLMVLPSDHLITDLDAFMNCAAQAAALASANKLVTFGIRPTRPETGYGYIKSGAICGPGFEVEKFVEKPDLATATAYLESGQYLWNSGMFCFTPAGFDGAARAYAPQLYQSTVACLEQTHAAGDEVGFDPDTFSQMPSISVDYAVFEKADNVVTVAGEFDWNDVGSWEAIADLQRSTQGHDPDNHAQGEAIFVNCQNVFVQSDSRTVAAIGLSNLVIVDTPDALLVSERSATQSVKAVVDELNRRGSLLTQTPTTQWHPWGQSSQLWSAEGESVMRITVEVGQCAELEAQNGTTVVSIVRGQGEFTGTAGGGEGGRWAAIESGQPISLTNTGTSQLAAIVANTPSTPD